jgi:hypothetical protein
MNRGSSVFHSVPTNVCLPSLHTLRFDASKRTDNSQTDQCIDGFLQLSFVTIFGAAEMDAGSKTAGEPGLMDWRSFPDVYRSGIDRMNGGIGS